MPHAQFLQRPDVWCLPLVWLRGLIPSANIAVQITWLTLSVPTCQQCSSIAQSGIAPHHPRRGCVLRGPGPAHWQEGEWSFECHTKASQWWGREWTPLCRWKSRCMYAVFYETLMSMSIISFYWPHCSGFNQIKRHACSDIHLLLTASDWVPLLL